MSRRMPFVALTLLMTVTLAAQRGGGGGGGGDFGGGAPAPGAKTQFDVIAEELKLDRKTQVPAVTELFLAAENESFAIVDDMLRLRQQLLNVETGAASAAQSAEAKAAYSASVERMLALEVRVFSGTYALLKPDQQARAPKAFVEMAGFYRALAPVAGAGRAGGRFGGRGGGR